MARKTSKSMRIRKYVLTHPNAKRAQIAEACGVTLQYVSQTLSNARRAAKSVGDKPNTLPVRGNGDEYEQKDNKWVAVAHVTSDTPVKPAEPDMVNHPPHYTFGGIETIDYIKAKLTPEEYRGYLKGNILKYGSRVGHKGDPAQDAGKLKWYATKYAEFV